MKKNGFTLVELLGVIVILAILVLLATPAVTSLITKSQKGTFKNEVLGFAKDAEKAYTEKSVDMKNTAAGKKSIEKIIAKKDGESEEKGYYYLCMELTDLVNEQYTKKDLEGYQGYVQMYVPDGEGETITFVNITDGKFQVSSTSKELSANDKLVVLPKGGQSYTCPTNNSVIPTSTSNLAEINSQPNPNGEHGNGGQSASGQNFVTFLSNLSDSDQFIKDDLTDDKNARFIGSNPNNYVKFGDDNTSCRIIGVFNQKTHGYNGNLVKVMCDYSIPVNTKPTNNDWATSPIMSAFNSASTPFDNYIKEVTWVSGAVDSRNVNDGTALDVYNDERFGLYAGAGNSTSWTGKIALPYLTDFMLATSGGRETREYCVNSDNLQSNDWKASTPEGAGMCTEGSWMLDGKDYITMAAETDEEDTVYQIKGRDVYSFTLVNVKNAVGAFPTFYLNENVVCTNCNDADAGTLNNPYKLAM